MIKFKEVEFDPLELALLLPQLFEEGFNENSMTKLLLACAITLAAIYLVISICRKIIEAFASIIGRFKKFSIPRQDKKLAVRRRQQFCGVLRSDLDTIAKAENWNDQWFADLEAEVEAEGGYYASELARLLKQRSHGVRRVPSLIQAIQSSTERCMLVVGEPGSGKSVALRHLGRVLAEKGSSARENQIKIPLYINLKEFPAGPLEALTASYVEQFVIDHIRRGDADTAAYVRDHWQDYKQQGIWFFLFDSFDEIPEVLHSPNGSQVIEQYTRAIRQFMDGMGTCRGVLASREYKGPEALTWQKLRILPLNQRRQDELINNTFLDSSQKSLVQQYLATVQTGIFGNPLFLSLLCLYIRDKREGPRNDYDLLLRHIQHLAQRDTDFVLKKYGLTAMQMMDGATTLAVLFAEDQRLSLAPRHDEIEVSLHERHWTLPVDLEHLLSALIDVKIGRSDVKEARSGDRRFTFSHRRYQETLFVQYLAKYTQHIPARELLLDSRWREFTVTLIQSQEGDVVEPLAQEAVKEIEALEQNSIAIPQEGSQEITYFDWSNDSLLHLLTILNEGFARRLNQVPDNLRLAIHKKLLPRWWEGDSYDRLMIIRHGCLMPILKYQEVMESAVLSGLAPFLQACFRNIHYLSSLPEQLTSWVRFRYANETLVAENSIELYRLDALGNRLPKQIGASIIFQRCCSLRAFLYNPRLLRTLYNRMALIQEGNITKTIFSFQVQQVQQNVTKYKYAYVLAMTSYFTVLTCGLVALAIHKNYSLWLVGTSIVLFIGALSFQTRLLLHAEPCRLSAAHLAHCFTRGIRIDKSIVILLLVLAFVSSVIYLVKTYLGLDYVVSLSAFGVICAWMLILVIDFKKTRRMREHWDSVTRNVDSPSWEIVKQANSPKELLFWLQGQGRHFLNSASSIRLIISHAESRFKTLDTLDEGEGEDSIYIYQLGMRPLINFLLTELEDRLELGSDKNGHS